MTGFAGVVVVASGLWLVGFSVAIFVTPAHAERLLRSFASSARAHFTEQILRLLAGMAIILFAPLMRFPDLFRVFGWVLIVTTAGLLLIPWRWHRQFAELVIPPVIRHMQHRRE